MSTPNTAIQKREVVDAVLASKEKFAGRLPSTIDADKFILGVTTAIQKNPDLLQCDPKSVLLAAYDAAELGISLSPALALGWLIPYGKVCNFQVSYRGLIQKAYETKAVRSLFAEPVYKGDVFNRQFAPKRNLFHAPGEGERLKADVIGAYAFIEFVDGTVDWEFMTTEQIERRRKHSRQPDSMMWTKFWEEGYRKTPIRLLWKRIPLSNPGMERLAEVVNRETEADADEPAGRLELETDSLLERPVSEILPKAAIPPMPKMHDVFYCVDKQQTLVTGDVRKIVSELPQVGAKFEKKEGVWKLPAARTHALVALLDKAGLTYAEVNERGAVIPPAAEAETVPPATQESEGEQGSIWPKKAAEPF